MGPEQTAPWGWILSTLAVRFIAVLVVLIVLGFGISLSAKIISKLPGGD
jgi:hypothetical protein